MQRREALRLLAASAATLPFLPRDAFSLFQSVHEDLSKTPALRTLNPRQNSAVIAVTDLVLPQTDTPGAKAARVNEFIDAILTDWYDDEARATFLAGLADLDVRSHDLCGKDFVDCEEKQQTRILEDLEDETVEGPGKPRRGPRVVIAGKNNFFSMAKQLTLVGYYTSQVGFEQELRARIIPGLQVGCTAMEEKSTK